MTNADKYLKDGVDVEEFIGEFNDFICRQTENQSACVRLAQFLKYPAKPTLTEDEKVILRNIREAYSMIGKYEYGDIVLKKVGDNIKIANWAGMFKKSLFQFIQPRRRI